MKRFTTVLHAVFFSVLSTASVLAADFPGSKDHPLIKRFASAEIIAYDYSKFDEYKIQTTPFVESNKTKEPLKTIEGAVTRIWYEIPGNNSSAEVFRNYINDLNSTGFKILYDSSKDEWLSVSDGRKSGLSEYYANQQAMPGKLGSDSIWYHSIKNPNQPVNPANNRKLTAQLSRPDGDVYATLFVARSDAPTKWGSKRGVYAALEVVDTGKLKQQMVTVSAGDMSKSINSTGRVALYGIYFDTNKSEVKPSSESALGEIAKMMKAEANLKLHIVGHTDNVGGLASNLDLSKHRAQAVVDALVKKYGIAPARLTANGVAYLAPVAPNTNEDGRALNRRVELVPQ